MRCTKKERKKEREREKERVRKKERNCNSSFTDKATLFYLKHVLVV
jgi:hypothetical protein